MSKLTNDKKGLSTEAETVECLGICKIKLIVLKDDRGSEVCSVNGTLDCNIGDLGKSHSARNPSFDGRIFGIDSSEEQREEQVFDTEIFISIY
jgi:hypothetical protein